MSDAPIGVLAQVLAAIPAALAFVAPDGSRAYENERMGALPAAVREQALDGARRARTDGLGFLELLDEQERIWRFDYTPPASAPATWSSSAPTSATPAAWRAASRSCSPPSRWPAS